MNWPFKDIERLSLSGNTWIDRRWCSRSLEKNLGGCREGDTSGNFGDGELLVEVALSLGLSINRPRCLIYKKSTRNEFDASYKIYPKIF